MMKSILFFFLFVSQTSRAANDSQITSCEVEKNKAREVQVIATNLANFNTTRTPEGGPYQRQKLVCQNHECRIEKFSNVIIKYLPGHIDADENGYVKFPDIDLQEEINIMRVVQRELESARRTCFQEMASRSSIFNKVEAITE